MGGFNNAEDQIDNALVNDLKNLKQDFYDFKTHPQRIGNGSLNYAFFQPLVIGPIVVNAGAVQGGFFTFMNVDNVFTYDGLPAINRVTSLDMLVTVFLGVHDTDHRYGFGTMGDGGNSGQFHFSYWCDMYESGFSETSGQRTIVWQMENKDTITHTYYLEATAIIPRPALKPQ